MATKCPFLEEVIVRYCTLCPIRKMLPKDSLIDQGPCCDNYQECSIYRDFTDKSRKFYEKRKDSNNR